MLCFCCSQGLKDWEDDDEPWTEHARWSPNCSYVLLSKGKTFVDKPLGKQKELPTIDQEVSISSVISYYVQETYLKIFLQELTKFVANHKDNYVFESNIKVSSTKM